MEKEKYIRNINKMSKELSIEYHYDGDYCYFGRVVQDSASGRYFHEFGSCSERDNQVSPKYSTKNIENLLDEGKYSKVRSILESRPQLRANLRKFTAGHGLISAVTFSYDFNKNIDEAISFLNYLYPLEDVNFCCKDGLTALFYVRDPRIIQSLIENGANINHQDNDGRTPLHFAAFDEDKQAIDCLLANGADPTIKNKQGKTAGDIAEHLFV